MGGDQSKQDLDTPNLVHSFEPEEGPRDRNRKMLVKVVMLGNGGVGKTSLMAATSGWQRTSTNWQFQFNEAYKPTIGADFVTCEWGEKPGDFLLEQGKQEFLEGVDLSPLRKITLQLWDTAGQERFQSLGVAFYRGSGAVVFCFDLGDRESFDALTAWRNKFFQQIGYDDEEDADGKRRAFPQLLVGLKQDTLAEHGGDVERAVGVSEALEWAGVHGALYCECSAKLGEFTRETIANMAALAAQEEPPFPLEQMHSGGRMVKSALKGKAASQIG